MSSPILVALGVRVGFVAVIGDDPEGLELETLLGDMATSALVHDRLRPTTLKTRYVAGNQQLLRVDREVAAPVAEGVATRVVERALMLLAGADLLVLSDLRQGSDWTGDGATVDRGRPARQQAGVDRPQRARLRPLPRRHRRHAELRRAGAGLGPRHVT